MRRIVIGLVVLVMAITATWYWTSPYFSIAALRNAAINNDTAALEDRVDFPRLRDNIKTQVNSLLINNVSENLKGNPFAALGMAIAAKMADVLVDAMITPAGLVKLVDMQKDGDQGNVSGFSVMLADSIKVERVGIDQFLLRSKDEQNRPALRFMRDGLFWKLVEIQVPKEFLANAVKDKGAARSAAPYKPSWDIKDSKDPMDDTVRVYLVRGAEEENQMRYRSIRPRIVFRCDKKRVEAFLDVDTSVEYSYESYRTSVRLRFDDDQPLSERWGVSDDREAMFIPDPMKFSGQFKKASKVRIEWAESGGGKHVATFALEDFESKFEQFQSKCGR